MEKEEMEILLTEWKAIREALLFFGRRRFAQFTVFMAANAFLVTMFITSDPKWWYQLPIIAVGFFLTIKFREMERLSVIRRDNFAERAKAAEWRIGTLKLMRESRLTDTIKKEAQATDSVYAIILILWGILGVIVCWSNLDVCWIMAYPVIAYV